MQGHNLNKIKKTHKKGPILDEQHTENATFIIGDRDSLSDSTFKNACYNNDQQRNNCGVRIAD